VQRACICLHLRTLFLAAVLMVLPSAASASLTGYMELSYTDFRSETEFTTGQPSSDSHIQGFRQVYSLTLDRRIYPKLRLLASGLFDQNISKGKIDDLDLNQRSTILRPFVQLSLDDPLYKADVGYSRADRITKVSGLPGAHFVNEQWLASVNWRPEGFPTFQLRGLRSNTFDADRLVRDNTDNLLNLTSEYRFRDFYLRYYGTYGDAKNRLEDLRTKTLSHTAQVTYDTRFFRDRVQVSADYQFSYRNIEAISGRGGDVLLPTNPFAGLSGIDDTPLAGALEQNSLLIDGNTTASAGIDLGAGPAGSTPRTWNMGLDLFSQTEVNVVYVWVDRELPPAVSNAFSWKVYVSSDNLFWTLADPSPSVRFGLFQNRFELRFPGVTSRFIKVVTETLSPTVPVPFGSDVSNIFVTELQALRAIPTESGKVRFSDHSHRINFYGRVNILDSPVLYYTTGYTSVISSGRAGSPSRTRWNFLNALNLNHRLSRVFSVSAKLEREDSHDTQGDATAHGYSVSVSAIPLRTLSHTLAVNGRFEENPAGRLTRNGVFLNNVIELYKGIRIYADGGVVLSGIETGQDQVSQTYNAGVEIAPRSNLTIALTYNSTEAETTGGGLPEAKTLTRTSEAGLSYSPFRTLHLILSLGRVLQQGRSFTLHNYGVTWSPFPGGAIQISLNYNENFRSDLNEKVRTFSPNVRWNFMRQSWLNVSYFLLKSTSDLARTNQKSFLASLRIGL